MQKHLTFADIPVNKLFVTGPSEILFVKLDNEDGLPNVHGGHAIAIADGTKVWTPSNRIVSHPKQTHFRETASKYLFELGCEAARKAHENS